MLDRPASGRIFFEQVLHDDFDIVVIDDIPTSLRHRLTSLVPQRRHPRCRSQRRAAGFRHTQLRGCEELAALTAEAILNRFGRNRSLRCAVLEDGILGAGVSWTPAPDH